MTQSLPENYMNLYAKMSNALEDDKNWQSLPPHLKFMLNRMVEKVCISVYDIEKYQEFFD